MLRVFITNLFKRLFPRVRGYAELHGSVTIGRRPRRAR
jgi:hypothetical protein